MTNRLTVSASGLMPGASYYRSLEMTNGGSNALVVGVLCITLTTTASLSSLLDMDATHGLQVARQRYTSAWTEPGTSPNCSDRYSCSGKTSTVLESRAVIGSTNASPNAPATATSTTDHLLLTVTLPGAAGNTFQGFSSTLNFTLQRRLNTAPQPAAASACLT